MINLIMDILKAIGVGILYFKFTSLHQYIAASIIISALIIGESIERIKK